MFKSYRVIFIAIFGLLLANISRAEQTCAQFLRTEHAKTTASFVAVPVIGWLGGLLFSKDLQRALKDASYLEAATELITRADKESESAAALAKVRHFYHKLVVQYPDMTLGINEVIQILYRFNINGRKRNGDYRHLCREVFNFSLRSTLFPEKNAREFMEKDHRWQKQENARQMQIAKARRIRDKKNEGQESSSSED